MRTFYTYDAPCSPWLDAILGTQSPAEFAGIMRENGETAEDAARQLEGWLAASVGTGAEVFATEQDVRIHLWEKRPSIERAATVKGFTAAEAVDAILCAAQDDMQTWGEDFE